MANAVQHDIAVSCSAGHARLCNAAICVAITVCTLAYCIFRTFAVSFADPHMTSVYMVLLAVFDADKMMLRELTLHLMVTRCKV